MLLVTPGIAQPPSERPMISSLDHLVLTVRDLNATTTFYSTVLGFNIQTFGHGRLALKFGHQKINLHLAGDEVKPHAKHPTSGSADLCFASETSVSKWIDLFTSLQIPVIEGPVERTGALGPITSIYIRDPDDNLIEIANYV